MEPGGGESPYPLPSSDPGGGKIDRKIQLMRVATIVLAVATAWVLLEWLFFVTKPSFMSLYSAWQRLGVLSGTTLVLGCALLALTLPFALLGRGLSRLGLRGPLLSSVVFLPAIVLSALAMLVVVDNFTLTVLGWGVRDAQGPAVLAYRAVSLALLVVAARMIWGAWSGASRGVLRGVLWAWGLGLIAGLPLLLLEPSARAEYRLERESEGALPNIVILSGDGITAEHMSLYGYERATTPFMDRVRDEFLIAENHFTNASDTGGAIISLLTGKLPTTTRVVYPPDVLRGRDSYQHLPGLLKTLGYYNADISVRHYADPYDLNLRNGFAEANFRRLQESGGTLVSAVRRVPGLNTTSLLIDRMSERIAERVGHIWRGAQMSDPLVEVNRPGRRGVTDAMRMAEVRRFISEAPQPFFLHVHTLGTHGAWFRPSQRVFSTEADRDVAWSLAGYDDAILEFDRMVESTYQRLEQAGLLESTLLVISSDHGFMKKVTTRLPLLIRLPDRSITGMIGGNTQRLDLAPTLIDALGLPEQDWMEGASLLGVSDVPAADRPIIASGVSNGEKTIEGVFYSIKNPTAPWYSLGRVFLIHCDQGFVLKVETMKVTERRIKGSTAVCDVKLTREEAGERLKAHLRDRDYRWE